MNKLSAPRGRNPRHLQLLGTPSHLASLLQAVGWIPALLLAEHKVLCK